MRIARRPDLLPFAASLTALIAVMTAAPAPAQTQLEELTSAVVRIKAFIDPDGRTVSNLGREREGSGVVIDENGLVLTIGYLMVEAHGAEVATNAGRTLPATVVGYDYDSGFGLLRMIEPPKLKPVAFGKSADLKESDPVLVISGGAGNVAPVRVAAKREFAGSWEYLLDEAIFTTPPYPAWSGAALINREGKLVGVGSLIVGDATGTKSNTPGNMFVPIDRLPPILAELIANGRVSGPGKPWLGVNTEEIGGRLFITRVTAESPAAKAGLQRGDIVVSVNGETPSSMADFYRKIWAKGDAGAIVALEVLQGKDLRRFEIKSMNRLDHLKLKSSL
jgi:S1-C subfamily serine protease